ncbi:PTS sugar transporter subunit IIB [Desulfonauticus submarinus]
MWVRIDNRLLHGQVLETWLPYVNAKTILVVNDPLAANIIQQDIMRLAVPRGIDIYFLSLRQVLTFSKNKKCTEALVLFANCADAKIAFDRGFTFKILNIGNLHYEPGKEQVCDHIALSKEDISCLRYLIRKGVSLDFRCVPHKQVQVTL